MSFRYVEAPEWLGRQGDADPPAVFLAGGITGCPDWQSVVAGALSTTRCVVLNPRRAHFDPAVDDARVQIRWEFEHLRTPRLLTLFWFPACDAAVTVQPIALFELGAVLGRQEARDNPDRRVMIGADPDYPRRFDVVEQVRLAAPWLPVHDDLDALISAARCLLDPAYAFETGSY